MSEVYEFTSEQNEALQGLVNSVRYLAYAVYLGGALTMALLTLQAVRKLHALGDLFPFIGMLLVTGAVTMVLAATLTRAASSFQLVIDTEGNDIEHALSGLDHFTSAFRVGGVAFWALSVILVGVMLFVSKIGQLSL